MSELLVAGMAYLDVSVPRVAPPAPGEERFVDAIGLRFGGAANSASVGAALGLRVTMCVPVGAGIADQALAALAARLGIALTPWPARDDPAVSLVLADEHDRAFVSAADFGALDRVTHLPPAKWIHVPGLEEAARLAAPLARARAEGAKVAVSGSWAPHRLAALAAQGGRPWDLLILNEKEAVATCGDAAAAPGRLADAATSVVVTLGPAGAFGMLDGETVVAAAVPVAVCDPTGAGDAFCAGMLAALIRGLAPSAALRFGSRAAAHILQQRGGVLQEPTRMAALAEEITWKF
ncbi:carbohydrate kinase family protein [Massilia glaciei]|uniref:Carbohydrate kinase family protein n=1 Tax=Massilia glaciei TaxID=1524097 RepID=A0A2U2HPL0_9BURK|nr:carbohydrate kinase family protein [Massilia glaciei]PWF49433.1 carbohydrate kinase family protein [Massilia glaciei]